MSNVPTNLIPSTITQLPEYGGSSTLGYFPYSLNGRTYKVQFSNLAAVGAVPSSRVIAAGTGLAGGGDLSENRVISIANGGVGFDQLSATGVSAGSYGSGGNVPVITVDAKGRVTDISTTPLVVTGYVPDSRTITTGAGLLGGGSLASNRTLSVDFYASAPQALGSASPGVSNAAARGDHVHPAVNLSDTTQTQGALPLGRGGTGDALSPVAGAVVYSTGTKFALADPGDPGQVLTSSGSGEPYWSTIAGTGTVTSVSVLTANGFSGTVAFANTTPQITISTTVSGLLKGDGVAMTAAEPGVDYALPGANTDITSLSGITGGIATPDYIDFDTTAAPARATGRLWWDNADGIQTLNLGMAGSNATLQIGEEMYFRIKASSAITEGQVVMFTGTVGNSGALTGAPATGLTKDTASYVMGVATEDIALNGWGYVTQFGLVRSINTTGGAEAWVDGQILYYDPAVAGGLTKNVPSAPAAKVEVAAVVKAASNGSLFVRPIARFSLGQLNDVETAAAANGDLLQYNGSGGYWQHVVPSTISVGTATNLAGGAANRIAYQTGAGATSFISAPVTPNTFLEWSGSGFQWSVNPLGTVTSVGMSVPTGLTVTGSPITTSGTLAVGLQTGYSIPTNASQANWDAAYSDRLQWDGGSTNLVAATGRTSLGLGTAAVLNAGVANGVATLDSAGTVPTSQLPAAVLGALNYQGAWNASTNTPTLASGVGTKGYFYVVDVAGSTNLDGITDWKVGDWAVFSGSVWQKIDNTESVVSVNGYTGVVNLTYSDVGAPSTSGVNATGTWAINVTGNAGTVTNGVYTSGSYTDPTWLVSLAASKLTGTVAVANGGTGATTAAGARTNLGGTTVGSNFFTLTNPSAITFPQINADNTVSALSAAAFRAAIGAGTGGGSVTSVDVSGGTTGLTFSGGPVTSSGTITMAGTLGVANGGTGTGTAFTAGSVVFAGASGVYNQKNANFFWDNTNNRLGIGTATPSNALHVNSGSTNEVARFETTGTSPYVPFYGSGGRTGYIQFGSGSANIFYDAAAPMVFWTSGTEQMRITSAGNLGIGTASPAGRLDVTATSAGGTTYSYFQNNGASGVSSVGLAFAQSSAIKSSIVAAVYGNDYMTFNVGSNTERMRIDASGNVGIGTSSPASKLNVSGGNVTVSAGYGIAFSGDQTRIMTPEDNVYGALINWASGGICRFVSGTTEQVRIDASGNLLVGTTTNGEYGVIVAAGAKTYSAGIPQYQLQAQDTTAIAAGVGGAINFVGKYTSGGAFTSFASVEASKDNATSGDYGAAMLFKTRANGGSQAERMRISSAGDVSIGTTSGGTGLFVVPRANVPYTIFNTASAGYGYSSYQYAGSAYGYLGQASSMIGGASNTDFAIRSENNMLFAIGGTERMRIDSSGRLLVGLSSAYANSPAGSIQYVGGAHLSSGNFGRIWVPGQSIGSATYAGLYGMASTYNAYYDAGWKSIGGGTASAITIDEGIFSFSNSNSVGSAGAALTWNTRLTINTSGSVGIGTSNPTTKLKVYGNTGNSPTIINVQHDVSGNTFDYASVSASSNTGAVGITSWATGSARGGTGWVQTVGSIPLVVGVNDTEVARFDTSGNFGIGTSSPGAKLDVKSQINVTNSSNVSMNAARGSSFGYSSSYNAMVIGATSGLTTVCINVDPSANAGSAFDGDGGEVMFRNGAKFITPNSGNTSYHAVMRMLDGNVGIGTSSPGQKLTLQGAQLIIPAAGWSSGQTAYLYLGDTNNGISSTNGSYTTYLSFNGHNWLINGTEAMRIDGSRNIGIGTTSPSTRFNVKGGTTWLQNFNGSASSPTETVDWPVPALNVTSFGDFTLQTMMAFTLPNDGNYFTGDTVWNIRLEQTASSITSSSSTGFRLMGPGYLAFGSGQQERLRFSTSGGITSSDLADAVGYKGLPQNQQTTTYTLALSDMGKHVFATAGTFTITIPANASVAFPVGTAITIFCGDATKTLAPAAGVTLIQAGTSNTGNRTLAINALVTLVKLQTNTWVVSGAGLS